MSVAGSRPVCASVVSLCCRPGGQCSPRLVPWPRTIGAFGNANLDIDGKDDERVDVDAAIIDAGVILDYPDLNIVARTNCVDAVAPLCAFETNSPDDGNEAGVLSTPAVVVFNKPGISVAHSGLREWPC
jgi:hypothetical protein